MLVRGAGSHAVNIGADSETLEGPPITFQFFSPDIGLEKVVWLDSPANATAHFFAALDSLPSMRGAQFIIWCHNLDFDMVSFFYDRAAILRNDPCTFSFDGWTANIVYSAVKFARFEKGHKRVLLVDTLAYFLTKLEKLAIMVCPDLPKLKQPEGLGSRMFEKTDKNFIEYAMRDAVIAYRAGCEIAKIHSEFDVSLSVSAPHFASKVFRHSFLKASIPLPPRKLVYSALASYHGGKNNLTAPKGIYDNVYALDIRSAYPFAMDCLPSFSRPELYKHLSGRGSPKQLPACAIYKITGNARSCKWPALYDHHFKPLSGPFKNVWVTGFELNEALRAQEITLEETEGYYYQAEKDTEPSPFRAYVQEFFSKKEKPVDKIHREFYKLLLNSLYGKFIQTRGSGTMTSLTFDTDDERLDEIRVLLAGGLFNPFIATLITGHTRAYIHRLEHEYEALHTSTDGIFTLRKPQESPGLGGLSIEAHGKLLLLRNKLYIIYGKTDKPEPEKLRSRLFPDLEIIKFALHGFHADVHTLEAMYQNGLVEYEYIKVNKLRESIRRSLTPNKFEKRRSKVNF